MKTIWGCIARLLVLLHLFLLGNATLFGVVAKNGVYVSAAKNVGKGLIKMKTHFKWIRKLDKNIAIGYESENSWDCDRLHNLLQAVCKDHTFSNGGHSLPCSQLAEYCRNSISRALRTSERFNVKVLIAAWDDISKKHSLYWIDELGTIQSIGSFAMHGYGMYVLLSFLDQKNADKPINDLEHLEAKQLFQDCWKLIEDETLIGKNTVESVMVDSHGIHFDCWS